MASSATDSANLANSGTNWAASFLVLLDSFALAIN